jgi:AraC-like DNA-binding protein
MLTSAARTTSSHRQQIPAVGGLQQPLQRLALADIALQVGFSDISYFNRLFRGRFGDSPRGVLAERAAPRSQRGAVKAALMRAHELVADLSAIAISCAKNRISRRKTSTFRGPPLNPAPASVRAKNSAKNQKF